MYSLIAAFGWGISPIAGRIVMQDYSNTTFVTIRALIIGLLCLIYLLYNQKSINNEFFTNDNLINIRPFIFTLIGGVVVFIGSLSYYTAVYNSEKNTICISLISYIAPLLIITLISTLFFKDKINLKMIIGMILTIIGICMVIYYNPN